MLTAKLIQVSPFFFCSSCNVSVDPFSIFLQSHRPRVHCDTLFNRDNEEIGAAFLRDKDFLQD
jgi:hypothetical protein